MPYSKGRKNRRNNVRIVNALHDSKTSWKPMMSGLVNNMGRRRVFSNAVNSKCGFDMDAWRKKQNPAGRNRERLFIENTKKENNRTMVETNLTSSQIIHDINSIKITNNKEYYSFNNNKSYSIIYLSQNSFDKGTVRITKPGHYILKENITFHPNPDNDFQPNISSIRNGQYPVGKDGAYHLGFFAAITIETKDVILDLNGFTIKQSREHNIQQRFFSTIELANAPFIPKQGPSSFSNKDNYIAANNVLIKNGKLGLSSHHGIHGNNMSRIVLSDLVITNFEVAAIAMNGATNSIVKNIKINGISQDIPLLSTYSQGRFIRTFLKKVKKENPNASLNVYSGHKSIDDIINELNASLDYTKNEVLNNRELSKDNIFKNENKLYDGNAYGIVLNVNGVVINKMITERTDTMKGNENIYLENIDIENIITEPVEIVGLSLKKEVNPSKEKMRAFIVENSPAYGGKSQVGPIGDVFEIEKTITVNNRYKENVLSNAQLIISKYINDENNGTSNIIPEIINWVENGTSLITEMNKSDIGFTYGGDSMGHHMKGNIGLFISGGKDISIKNLNINGVISKGNRVGNSISHTSDNIDKKLGSTACGCCITASNNIFMENEKIYNIVSQDGDSTETKELNSSIIHL
uniref:Uncharacterized protein n=1 Tax=viral metagenome TaxID=1070528 RepID=A0A6C0C4A9_9ZZZZ